MATFTKVSLASQVADRLRQNISLGMVTNPLPGENALADQFGVSRPTLRDALKILAREQTITIRKGRRTLIRSKPTKTSCRKQLRICVLRGLQSNLLDPSHNVLVAHIRLRFAGEGLLWEDHYEKSFYHRAEKLRLEDVVKDRPDACWLLIGVSEWVQQFFAQSKLPCLVLGTNFPGTQLPAVDWHYEATGHHAAARLLRAGHRRIAILLPDPLMAGDLATLRGFESVMRQAEPTTLCSRIPSPSDKTKMVTACSQVLRTKNRPDAVFCLRVEFALALISLAQQGTIKVPADIAVLCRDDHPLLDSFFPSIDRYAINESRLVHNATRYIRQMLENRHLEPESHFVMPEALSGETVLRPIASLDNL